MNDAVRDLHTVRIRDNVLITSHANLDQSVRLNGDETDRFNFESYLWHCP